MQDRRFHENFVRIGKNIKKYRKQLGLTQIEFANKASISYSYLTQIEVAVPRAEISLHMLFILADALEVDPIKLLE